MKTFIITFEISRLRRGLAVVSATTERAAVTEAIVRAAKSGLTGPYDFSASEIDTESAAVHHFDKGDH